MIPLLPELTGFFCFVFFLFVIISFALFARNGEKLNNPHHEGMDGGPSHVNWTKIYSMRALTKYLLFL